jgi:hypothetical protein
VFSTRSVLRALRDLAPAMFGLLLVLAVAHGGCVRASAVAALCALLVLGVAGHFFTGKCLPQSPVRAVSWIELRTIGLIGGVYILCYGLVIFGFMVLVGRIHSDTGKYFVSAASGFVLAAVLNALIKPGESESWSAYWVKRTFVKRYEAYFRDKDGDPRFWSPMGDASHAVQDDPFHPPANGKPIKGWGLSARRERAKFLQGKLAERETPEERRTALDTHAAGLLESRQKLLEEAKRLRSPEELLTALDGEAARLMESHTKTAAKAASLREEIEKPT